MDYLAGAALVLSLIILIWLLASMWSMQNFDPSIIPNYPPATVQEQLNTGTTKSYLIYPRVPYGTTFTNL